MHNEGFLIRAVVTVIDHRDSTKHPERPLKMHFEELVDPGENVYKKLREMMADISEKAVSNVSGCKPMNARAREVSAASDNT